MKCEIKVPTSNTNNDPLIDAIRNNKSNLMQILEEKESISKDEFQEYIIALFLGLNDRKYDAWISSRSNIKKAKSKEWVQNALLEKVEQEDYLICLMIINDQFKESTINITSNITEISDIAFISCKHLKEVNFKEATSLTRIGDRAFYQCNNLSTITLPASVQNIGKSAFSKCKNLSTLTFEEPSQIESIGDNAFHGSGLVQINIPAGVNTIGENAFSKCENLTTITLPASVKSIGSMAFFQCKELSTLTFEESSCLESIGSFAFRDSGLTTINIPKSVNTIEKKAFSDCEKLEAIYVPSQFMGMDDVNYWSERGVDPKTIKYQDVLYEVLHNEPYNIENLAACESPQFNAGQLKEYARSLVTIQDQTYRAQALEYLLNVVPVDKGIAYYKALLKDPLLSDMMKIDIIRQFKKTDKYEYGELADEINQYLQRAFENGSIEDIKDLYEHNNISTLLSKLETPAKEMSLDYKFNTLHVDEDGNLHVLLPFARGINGIITDNTCKATKELELALDKNNPSSVVQEIKTLEKELHNNLNAFSDLEGTEHEVSLILKLLEQINKIKASELYQYVMEDTYQGLPSKIKSIVKFPDEINGLLENDKSNLYSIVLSPQEQDPYLRSADTAVCSFGRAKDLVIMDSYTTDWRGRRIFNGYTQEITRDETKNSSFSRDLKLRLMNTSVTKQKGKIEIIIDDVMPSEFDSIKPDPRILLALQKENEEKIKNKQDNITQCGKDLEVLENEGITFPQFIPIANRNGGAAFIRKFKSDPENAIQSLKKSIEAKKTKLLEEPLENTGPEVIYKKAKEQTKIIYAVKKAYIRHMKVNEDDATKLFEKVFQNDADIDLTDMKGILNTIHTPDEWGFYDDAYDPFYNPTKGLSGAQPTEAVAAKIDIAAQFFIGKLNVYCVKEGLTRKNFGKILDDPKNTNLRSACINTIAKCLSEGASVEEGLFNFISENSRTFDLSKMPNKNDLPSIQQSFNEQYSLIKDLKEKDEFFLYEESRSPTFIQRGYNICFSMSELAKTYYKNNQPYNNEQRTDNEYHLDMAEKFTELCTNSPSNTLPDVQNFYANDVILKMRLLNLKETDKMLNILKNCAYLPDNIRESCDFYTTTRDCVQGMSEDEYKSFLTLLGAGEDGKLLTIFPEGYTDKGKADQKQRAETRKEQLESILKDVRSLKSLKSLRRLKKPDNEYNQKRQEILKKLVEQESTTLYQDIFNELKKTEKQSVKRFKNPLFRWFVKNIWRYFSNTKIIIETMRDHTTNDNLKREMNDYLIKEYRIDKKDNSKSQGRRHQ